MCALTAHAQDGQAEKILKKLEKKYENSAFTFDFTMTSKEAEAKKSTITKGIFHFTKNAYCLLMDNQKIYFDGKTQWTYMLDRNEVQITHSELDESAYHPLKFIKLYRSNHFKYRTESSNASQITVEFVPLDDQQDYFKIKLMINKKTSHLNRIELFLKRGSKFNLQMAKVVELKSYDLKFFQLDTQSLKGVHIEDLR